MTRLPATPELVLLRESHAATLKEIEAWNAKREALIARVIRVAERRVNRLDGRLYRAVLDLTPVIATSTAGLAAKARAVAEIDREGTSPDEWLQDLRASIIRDAIAIGSA